MEEPNAGSTGIPEEKPSICRAKPSFYVLRAEERQGFLKIRVLNPSVYQP
jgi:hypothetical protein